MNFKKSNERCMGEFVKGRRKNTISQKIKEMILKIKGFHITK